MSIKSTYAYLGSIALISTTKLAISNAFSFIDGNTKEDDAIGANLRLDPTGNYINGVNENVHIMIEPNECAKPWEYSQEELYEIIESQYVGCLHPSADLTYVYDIKVEIFHRQGLQNDGKTIYSTDRQNYMYEQTQMEDKKNALKKISNQVIAIMKVLYQKPNATFTPQQYGQLYYGVYFDGGTSDLKGFHRGIDVNNAGSTIYSLFTGIVIKTSSYTSIDIWDPNTGYTITYMHIDPDISVSAGDLVKRGEKLGTESNYLGGSKQKDSKGNDMNIHTHIEVNQRTDGTRGPISGNLSTSTIISSQQMNSALIKYYDFAYTSLMASRDSHPVSSDEWRSIWNKMQESHKNRREDLYSGATPTVQQIAQTYETELDSMVAVYPYDILEELIGREY